ncbi:MAG: HPr family phosphocarrier protein [Muribaculaceae bacterium]|nr:HPr family phosphocarrier protein [Alistipes senegalensis]MCM1478756.1 HPr family phosphocarrier protein [Muribaculaceae bacterium]
MENNLKLKIFLKTSKDVKNFCFETAALPRIISVKVSHGDYVVDGKSILGVFSLNLSEYVTATFTCETKFDTNKIKKAFNPWIVEIL